MKSPSSKRKSSLSDDSYLYNACTTLLPAILLTRDRYSLYHCRYISLPFCTIDTMQKVNAVSTPAKCYQSRANIAYFSQTYRCINSCTTGRIGYRLFCIWANCLKQSNSQTVSPTSQLNIGLSIIATRISAQGSQIIPCFFS